MSIVNQQLPPGPRPTPLLGARGNMVRFLRDPIRYMEHLYRNYGDIASLARGTTEYMFVFGADYNRIVLGDTTLFFNLDATAMPFRIPQNSALSRLYSGLIQMNGNRHDQQRRLMTPAFGKTPVQSYLGDIVNITERTLAEWQVGERRDLAHEMKKLTLSIAVKTLLGLDPERGGDAMGRLVQCWTGLVFSLATIFLPFDLPGFSYHRLLTLSDHLEDEIKRLIAIKRTNGACNGDVLSVLMRAHDQDDSRLSDDELVGQTNFLFMAGHATTASALTWTLFLLAQHPSVLSDLLDECTGKMHGAAPTPQELENLPLLDAVIKESMRLLPPVIWWSRISTAPFHLGPYELPRGTRVIQSAYMTHRIAECFPQPNRFLPDRWLAMSPGPFEYCPFSAGPRMCLGSGFAMSEIKLVLALILHRFGLSLPPRTKVDFGGLMLSAPKPGMPMNIGRPGQGLAASEVHGSIRSVVDLPPWPP